MEACDICNEYLEDGSCELITVYLPNEIIVNQEILVCDKCIEKHCINKASEEFLSMDTLAYHQMLFPMQQHSWPLRQQIVFHNV